MGKRSLGLSALLVTVFALAGCARGAVKGPVGQDQKGVGLKVPILDLFKRDTYDPDQFTPDNISEKEINPFRPNQDTSPESQEPFSRYDERSESF
ncbi:MAG: hypothetical protein HUU16_12725 [Candidatus Omnitrophica bacterium]|nr:hypothetical protein [bacterium]NUN97031.1 hypothetical protein [Candidatus Omnitrophota bacterium]